MYEKNLKSVTHLDLNILLTIFLNKAAILLLIFSFSSDLKKKSLSLLLLTFTLKTLCLFIEKQCSSYFYEAR